MHDARQADADHMQDHQRQRNVGERAVQLANDAVAIFAVAAWLRPRRRLPSSSIGISRRHERSSDCCQRPLPAVAISHEAGDDSRRKRQEEQNHHRAAGRAVAEIAAGAAAQQIHQIAGQQSQARRRNPESAPAAAR